MSALLENLLLVLGGGGFLALGTGCLVFIVYLLYASRRASDYSGMEQWKVRLLAVVFGSPLLALQCVVWLWHLVLPARLMLTPQIWQQAPEPWRVNLFPWD